RLHLQAAQEARQRIIRKELHRDGMGPRLCAARTNGCGRTDPRLAPGFFPALRLCDVSHWLSPIVLNPAGNDGVFLSLGISLMGSAEGNYRRRYGLMVTIFHPRLPISAGASG